MTFPKLSPPFSDDIFSPNLLIDFLSKKKKIFSFVGINSHWEVLEATRPIGIVHVVDRVTANQSLTSGIDQRLQQLRYNNRTSVLDSSVSFDCRHNLTVSLYLPQRLHSNPPSAGLGAVSKNLHHKKPPFFFYLNIFIFFFFVNSHLSRSIVSTT